MDMIFSTPDLQGTPELLPGHSAKILVKALLEIRVDHGQPVSCAEDHVDKEV
jgi:hypothetical protein